ncbi:MAG: hypothetical protein WDN26_08910 [Chitinophagaceae bacterium]
MRESNDEVISKQPNDNTLKAQLATLGMTDTINNGRIRISSQAFSQLIN